MSPGFHVCCSYKLHVAYTQLYLGNSVNAELSTHRNGLRKCTPLISDSSNSFELCSLKKGQSCVKLKREAASCLFFPPTSCKLASNAHCSLQPFLSLRPNEADLKKKKLGNTFPLQTIWG